MATKNDDSSGERTDPFVTAGRPLKEDLKRDEVPPAGIVGGKRICRFEADIDRTRSVDD